MLTIVCFGDLLVNKVSVSFLQQMDIKNKNKSYVQLYRFVINGLSKERARPDRRKHLKNRRSEGTPFLKVLLLPVHILGREQKERHEPEPNAGRRLKCLVHVAGSGGMSVYFMLGHGSELKL